MGVAIGVAFGSVLQLLIAAIGLIGVDFKYQFRIFWKNRGFQQVMKLLPTRSMDQGLDYVNSIVETNMASRMGSGTVRAYSQSLTLQMMPVNLIGVAISTAFFPNLTERLAIGRKDLFRKDLQSALRMIIFLALPVSVLFFFLRGYIVSFIKNGGDDLIAGLLGVLVLSIFARSIYHIAARSAVLEIAILLFLMRKRIDGLFDAQFLLGIFRMVIASATAGLICYLLVARMPLLGSDLRFFSTFPKFMFIGLVSSTTYVLVAKLLKLEEAEPIISQIKKMIFVQVKIK